MRPLFFSFVLFLAACGESETATNDATTGGETATQPDEPEAPIDESGSVSAGSSGSSGGSNGCERVDCQAGETCVMVQVQCIRAPCPPQPTCVATSSTCAATLCAQGTICVESAGGARCVPNP